MASEIKVDTVSEKTSANGVTIDGVNIKDSKITTANSIDSDVYVDGSIDTAHIADDQITLAKMASGTDGNIISYDASGNPVAIATGSDGQVLTSTGAGSPPAFEAISAGVAGITTNSSSGTAQTINSDNSVTFPLQPHVVSSQTDQNDKTGDNTSYTVLYAAIIDVTSYMNEGTGTFTAPQAGVYLVNASILFDGGFDSSHSYHNISIVSSNRTYSQSLGTTDVQDSNGRADMFSIACDMDASDTVTITVQTAGSGKTLDLGTDGRLTITKIN